MKGSLQKRKNNKGELVWRAQWREGKGKTKTLGLVREISRAQAVAMLDAIIRPLQLRSASPGGSVTLGQFVLNEYLVAKSTTWKRSTELTTTELLEGHLLPTFADRLLGSITRKELQSLLNAKALTHSASVVNRLRFQIRAIFTLAAGDGRIIVNPSQGLETPRGAKKRVAPVVAEQSQINRALVTMPPMERLFTALCELRGMRPGEVVAVKIGDVTGDILRVERRYYRGGLDLVKTDRPRTVPLGELLPLVNEYCSMLRDQSADAWMFPNERGDKPRNVNALYRRRIAPLLKAAGVEGVNFQSMRATFANNLRSVEPDAKTRADIMGHSRAVHENEYNQVTDDEKRAAIRKLGDNLQ
jgi:integrase